MTSSNYQSKLTTVVLGHFPSRTRFVRDEADAPDNSLLIQARVRSGDYFMTLATELDAVVQEYENSPRMDIGVLERLVAELIYVHRHFDVIRKSA